MARAYSQDLRDRVIDAARGLKASMSYRSGATGPQPGSATLRSSALSLAKAGRRTTALPAAYSPDFNPIELFIGPSSTIGAVMLVSLRPASKGASTMTLRDAGTKRLAFLSPAAQAGHVGCRQHNL